MHSAITKWHSNPFAPIGSVKRVSWLLSVSSIIMVTAWYSQQSTGGFRVQVLGYCPARVLCACANRPSSLVLEAMLMVDVTYRHDAVFVTA